MITRDNNVVGWPRQSTIQISVEARGLSGLDNATIRRVVQRAADVWNRESTGPARPTDAPRFEMLPDAAPPIEDNGFGSFLDSIGKSAAPQRPFVLHLVLEDTADEIMVAAGAAGKIGATRPIYSGITPAAAVTVLRAMRGTNDTDMEWDEPSLEELVVHELGHALLLDHAENPSDRVSRDPRVPAMYPVPRRNTLAADDRASLAFVYPRADAPARYRRVSGVVTLAGQNVINANVIFETRDGTPSSYSAFTHRNEMGNTEGRYDLYVPPGRYRRYVQNAEYTDLQRDTLPRIESPMDVDVPDSNDTFGHDVVLP